MRPILPRVLRLVTIPISHYCEKARWALDRAGLRYREERHVQGIHRIAARRAGGGATVPVLVTPDGVLGESEEILAWVDERTPAEHRLFPDEPAERADVERLCRRFDEVLGPTGRRLLYVHTLAQPKLMLPLQQPGRPALGGSSASPRMAARRAMGAARARRSVQGSRSKTRPRSGASSTSSPSSSPTRKHLCGERFGAADLTFAALSASVVVPPVYGVPLPQPEALPAHTAALVERAREHPAGRYALALFAEHRRERVA